MGLGLGVGPGLGAGPMTISPIYNSQLYILRYTTKAKVKNEPFCQTRKINIRIKFYLFCRTHAFEHHRYIVEFYITKLSLQCSLPMWLVCVLALLGPSSASMYSGSDSVVSGSESGSRNVPRRGTMVSGARHVPCLDCAVVRLFSTIH